MKNGPKHPVCCLYNGGDGILKFNTNGDLGFFCQDPHPAMFPVPVSIMPVQLQDMLEKVWP